MWSSGELPQAVVLTEMRKSVCVIGGGLAGGIVASTLAARGHSVSLVELGDAPAPLLPSGEVWEGMEVKSPFTRGSGIGGTSNFWHGGLTILDRTDVEGISDHDGRARAPIAYSRLRDYYAQAVALVRGERSFSLDDIEAPLDVPIAGFGLTGDTFRLKALLYPDKAFSSRPLIRRAQGLHGLKVFPNIKIGRLVNTGPRRVTYAEGVDLRSGAGKKFPADIFVLSAGGLGSPKILLQSTGECPPLEQLPIGKFMIDHPTGFVFKAKLRRRMDLKPLFGVARRGYKLRYGFALNPDRLGDADFRNHILYLRPAISMKDPATYDFLKRKLVTYRGKSLSPIDIAYLVRHADLLFDAINFKFGLSYSTSYVSGLVFCEQLPDANGRMHRLDNGMFNIKWSVSDKDCRSLEKFLAMFLDNYSEQFESFNIFPGMSARLDSAGHHSGACRMAMNASEGVVDADLRVFGTDNLFVVDGSALAHSGHANTGLTIAALALKCCDAVADV
jgi:choline dehydrogenase-like flavoprotein